MKVLMLYHPRSDTARRVEEFAHEFQRLHNLAPELISLETRDGAAMASLYDVVHYPAILVTTDIGELLQVWQDEQLPLYNEVASYLHA